MAKRPDAEASLREIASRAGVTVPWDRITINRWKPDTCGCVIEQWFDDDARPRIISYGNILNACPEHTATGETLWLVLGAENARKNGVLAIVEATISRETRDDRTTWAFTTSRLSGLDERVLEVTISGTTRPLRDTVQGAADVQFGSGAVVVR
jgi:hypothetical protein